MAFSSELRILPYPSHNAKTITIQDATSYTSLAVDAGDERGLIKIVDPDGLTSYNNTSVGSPDITALSKTVSSVNAGTDIITMTAPHGLVTGDPVRYNAATSADSGLTNNANYFVIYVSATTLKLATTLENAKAETAISLSADAVGAEKLIYKAATIALPLDGDGNVKRGGYTVTLTMFDKDVTGTTFERSIYFDYDYSRPSISLSISHSVINPIFFKSVDETSYDYNGVTPTITRTHTLFFPKNKGSYSVTTKTLNTNSYYTGASTVYLLSVTDYVFATAYYTDDTANLVNWRLSDSFFKNEPYTVSDSTSVCDYYSCIENLFDKVQEKRLKNANDYESLKADLDWATLNWQMLQNAINCSKSEDFQKYITQIEEATGCTGNCDSGQVSLVTGIGVVDVLDKRYEVTAPTNLASYTFLNSSGNAALIGFNYNNGDVLIYVDGLLDTGGSLDSSTGTYTFGSVVTNGAVMTAVINQL